MFNVGGGELLVIALIALIVFGPQRLPEALRTFGRVVGEIRRVSSGFQQELRDAFEDSDVARAAGAPRRREAVPLAAAVADTDTDADTGSDSDAGTAPTGRSRVESPPGDAAADDGPGVAPVIAEALDAIVAPLDPTDPGDPASPGDAAEPARRPDLGDERAAS
jgi:sec-independent protein translocase protein TatB